MWRLSCGCLNTSALLLSRFGCFVLIKSGFNLLPNLTKVTQSGNSVYTNVVVLDRPCLANVPNVQPPRSLQNHTFGFRHACVLPQMLCPRAYVLFNPERAGIFQALVDVENSRAIPQHDQPDLFL